MVFAIHVVALLDLDEAQMDTKVVVSCLVADPMQSNQIAMAVVMF